MGVERVYRHDGLPAYVLVSKTAKGGTTGSLELVYPNNPSFERLWDKGGVTREDIVAEPLEAR